jgi:hypothetical protein
LECWNFPSPGSNAFSFDVLFRGFVPTSLYTCVRSCLPSNKDASAAILTVISTARTTFRKGIWATRNRKMNDLEKSKHITDSDKRAPRRFIVAQSVTPTPRDDRWKTWMYQSLVSNRPWQGFHLRINSLIF